MRPVLFLLSVWLLVTLSNTSRAMGKQGLSAKLITCSYAYGGPPFDVGQTPQSSQGLAVMGMCLRAFSAKMC